MLDMTYVSLFYSVCGCYNNLIYGHVQLRCVFISNPVSEYNVNRSVYNDGCYWSLSRVFQKLASKYRES